jgi:hypothetical protein
MALKRKRHSTTSRQQAAIRSIFPSKARKHPGTPTALLAASYVSPRGKRLTESLSFFVSREGDLVELWSGSEQPITLRPAGGDSFLTTRLPSNVIAPEVLQASLGWTERPKGEIATMHALSSAFAGFFSDIGVASGTATWISAQVTKRTTQIAVHVAETGKLLMLLTIPTIEAFLVYSLTGWGFGWKLLWLAAALLILAAAAAVIFGSGPYTWAVFAAASKVLAVAFVLLIVGILIQLLDILLEIVQYLFPGSNLLARVQAAVKKAKDKQKVLQDKKDAGDEATKDEVKEVKDLYDEASAAADDAEKEIDKELPGATGDRKKQLEAGKKGLKSIRDAIKEAMKFLDGLLK